MALVGIIFFSGTGTTKALTKFISQGIEKTAAEYLLFEITGEDIKEGRWQNTAMSDRMDQCDALIFGSPTYMGGISAQLKSFFDAMAPRWFTQAWNGKVAAAYTVSSLASGDKLNCLQDISTFAMQMGMIWVGVGANISDQVNPNGFYLGLGATASSADQLEEIDVNSGIHFGQRIANTVERLTKN